MSTPNQNQPGLVASHAQYVKGAAVNTIGSVTGSKEWKDSGVAQKEQAITDMKAAGQNRDPATSDYGKAEEVAGKLTSCEGMEKEGAGSKKR